MKLRMIVSALFIIFLIVSIANNVNASQDIKVLLNGEEIPFPDVKPTIINDRVYVPFRAIIEKMYGSIRFYPESQTAIITRGAETWSMQVGSSRIARRSLRCRDGIEWIVRNDDAPLIIDDRLLLPIRSAFAPIINVRVSWDGDSQTVFISDDISNRITSLNEFYETHPDVPDIGKIISVEPPEVRYDQFATYRQYREYPTIYDFDVASFIALTANGYVLDLELTDQTKDFINDVLFYSNRSEPLVFINDAGKIVVRVDHSIAYAEFSGSILWHRRQTFVIPHDSSNFLYEAKSFANTRSGSD